MINILGNNMSITQILHLLMCDFVHEKYQVNTENCTQLNGATQEYTKHTPTNYCSSPCELML